MISKVQRAAYQPKIHLPQKKYKHIEGDELFPEWAIERSIAKRLLIDFMTLRLKRTPTANEVMREYRRRRANAKRLIWPQE